MGFFKTNNDYLRWFVYRWENWSLGLNYLPKIIKLVDALDENFEKIYLTPYNKKSMKAFFYIF